MENALFGRRCPVGCCRVHQNVLRFREAILRVAGWNGMQRKERARSFPVCKKSARNSLWKPLYGQIFVGRFLTNFRARKIIKTNWNAKTGGRMYGRADGRTDGRTPPQGWHTCIGKNCQKRFLCKGTITHIIMYVCTTWWIWIRQQIKIPFLIPSPTSCLTRVTPSCMVCCAPNNPPRGRSEEGDFGGFWEFRIDLNGNVFFWGVQKSVLDLWNRTFHEDVNICHFVVFTRKVKFGRIDRLWPKYNIFVQMCCKLSTNLIICGRLQPFGNVFGHFWKNQKFRKIFTFPNTPLGPPGFYNINLDLAKNVKSGPRFFEMFSSAKCNNPPR